ncbi:MAG: aromatic ring-hydroxylating dioxygenase subunit alpha [Planctomycetota bacterium]|nr:aromatic ring-hydroxylating dioxygenase subunit alpha [Planctomycetota bacterium]
MTSTRSSCGTFTLPGEYYTSKDIHERERKRIFGLRWQYAGHVGSLPKPGDYFLAEVNGESLIIVRGQDEKIRAFYNVCRHRGTRLCSEATGAFGKHIVCPYHAWAYDLKGNLAAAPIMSEVEGFDPESYPLHPVSVGFWEGLIFVNLSEQAELFEEAIAPVLGKFSEWNLESLVSVHQTRYEVKANWKLMVQNYSECYHCPSLHPQLNKLTPFRDSINDLEAGAILGGPMKLSSGSQSMTMDGRTCAAPFGHLEGDDLNLVHYYVFFPSMFLSLMPDYVLIHRALPRSPNLTTIICDWFFSPEAIAQPDFDPSSAVDFWDMTNRQDWHICEQSQLGIESRAYQPGPYANLESMLAALDREYLAAMDQVMP